MAERALVEFPDDFEVLPHVARAVSNSDCRSPVVFVQEDGDPFLSVCALANEQKSAVWSFDLSVNCSASNIMDYVEVGVNNGDWVFVSNCDTVDESFFRDVARTLYQLKPEPDRFPRRECFRAFFTVSKPFNPNALGHVPFPAIFLQYAIIARKIRETDAKWSRIVPVNDPLFTEAQTRHEERRAQGRDSDSESDIEEGDHVTGKLFFRSAELSENADNSPVTEAKQVFEKAVREQDVDVIKKLVQAAEVDISRPFACGMTPIQYACCAELTQSALALLKLGADPSAPRQSDGRPPIFMCLEDVKLVKGLLDAGIDVYTKFQGYRVDRHPETSPDVAAYVMKRIAEETM